MLFISDANFQVFISKLRPKDSNLSPEYPIFRRLKCFLFSYIICIFIGNFLKIPFYPSWKIVRRYAVSQINRNHPPFHLIARFFVSFWFYRNSILCPAHILVICLVLRLSERCRCFFRFGCAWCKGRFLCFCPLGLQV